MNNTNWTTSSLIEFKITSSRHFKSNLKFLKWTFNIQVKILKTCRDIVYCLQNCLTLACNTKKISFILCTKYYNFVNFL